MPEEDRGICQRRKEELSHRLGQRDMTEEDRGI